jgi:hypothetical protein
VAVERLRRAVGKPDEVLQAKHLRVSRLPILRPAGHLEVHGARNKSKSHYRYQARQHENAEEWTAAITRRKRNCYRTDRSAEGSP